MLWCVENSTHTNVNVTSIVNLMRHQRQPLVVQDNTYAHYHCDISVIRDGRETPSEWGAASRLCACIKDFAVHAGANAFFASIIDTMWNVLATAICSLWHHRINLACADVCSVHCSDGSRISQGARQSIIWKKLHENERNLTEVGSDTPWIRQCIIRHLSWSFITVRGVTFRKIRQFMWSKDKCIYVFFSNLCRQFNEVLCSFLEEGGVLKR